MRAMNSREEFEEWAFVLELGRDADGSYLHSDTQYAWLAWQAATERAAQIAISEPRVWDGSAPDPQHRIAAKIKGGSQ